MPWIAAGAALGGAAISYYGGEKRNEAQVGSAREQMEFQERMSNTAHQRQYDDLKKAGLNPILSAKYGGASSPGGAMPSIQDTLTPAVNSGWQAYKTQAEVTKAEAETELISEDTRRMTEEVAKSTHEAELLGYEASYKKWFMDLNLAEREIAVQAAQEQLKIIKRAGGRAGTNAGIVLGWISEIVKSISPFVPKTSMQLGK